MSQPAPFDLAAAYDLTGRVAIVTGGGSGIGAAIAMLLAQRGARVAVAGRRLPPLEEAAQAITAATGQPVIALPTDVREAGQAKALIDGTLTAFGRLDILINNAGKGWHAPLRTMPADAWDKDIALNLSAAFHCSQAAYPALKASGAERPGSAVIINISSLAGVHGTMGVGAYSAAKAGLHQLTRVAAAEWGPRGIRVNAVAPGMIATELAQAGWAKTGFDATTACVGFPLRRPGTPQEVAHAVGFLASDAAAYITGELLSVAGGPQLKGMIDTDEQG